MPNGPRAGRLDRAAFVAGILNFVADRGLPDLSTRSLGEQLGMSHMAVYHHFPGGKEELLQVTIEAVLAQVSLPDTDLDWISWLVEVAETVYAVLSRYPGVGAHILARHPVYVSRGGVGLIDTILTGLLTAGLSGSQAAEVWTLCETWLAGQLWLAEAIQRRPSTAASDLEAVLRDEVGHGTVGLRAVADALAAESASRHFSSGLRDLLVGFASRHSLTRPQRM